MLSKKIDYDVYNFGYNLGAWLGAALIGGLFVASAMLWLPTAAILTISLTFSYLFFIAAGFSAAMGLLAFFIAEEESRFFSRSLIGLFFFGGLATACFFVPVFPLALIGLIVTAFGAGLFALALGEVACYLNKLQMPQSSQENHGLFVAKDIQNKSFEHQNNKDIQTNTEHNLVPGNSFFSQDYTPKSEPFKPQATPSN